MPGDVGVRGRDFTAIHGVRVVTNAPVGNSQVSLLSRLFRGSRLLGRRWLSCSLLPPDNLRPIEPLRVLGNLLYKCSGRVLKLNNQLLVDPLIPGVLESGDECPIGPSER